MESIDIKKTDKEKINNIIKEEQRDAARSGFWFERVSKQ